MRPFQLLLFFYAAINWTVIQGKFVRFQFITFRVLSFNVKLFSRQTFDTFRSKVRTRCSPFIFIFRNLVCCPKRRSNILVSGIPRPIYQNQQPWRCNTRRDTPRYVRLRRYFCRIFKHPTLISPRIQTRQMPNQLGNH